jgi:hypothetical protein
MFAYVRVWRNYIGNSAEPLKNTPWSSYAHLINASNLQDMPGTRGKSVADHFEAVDV